LRAIKVNEGNLIALKPLVGRAMYGHLKRCCKQAYKTNSALWFIPMHIRADTRYTCEPMNMIVPYTYIQKHFNVACVLNGVEDWVELIPKVKKKV
jgi:hypothetical protein